MSATGSSEVSERKLDIEKLYYKDLERQFVVDLLKKEGDFLLRRGRDGGIVLSVHHLGEILHFKFNDNQKDYRFEGKAFPTLQDLLQYYFKTGETLTRATGAKLINPIEMEFNMIDQKRIKLDKKLGSGNFGEVWRARLLPGQGQRKEEIVAVKILGEGCTEKERNECMSEARVMAILGHENVVGFRGVSFATMAAGIQMQLILEYCNGSLDQLLKESKMTDVGRAWGLLDTAKGLAYLHDREIIHRDIASRNCLAHKAPQRTVVKVADFGLSRVAPNQYEMMTKRRLPIFSMPPEAIQMREWNRTTDVWSYGILILEMYNKGRNPYEAYFNEKKMDVKAVVKYLNDGHRLDPPRMPTELVELVAVCLRKAPSQRPTMLEIVDKLKKYVKRF